MSDARQQHQWHVSCRRDRPRRPRRGQCRPRPWRPWWRGPDAEERPCRDDDDGAAGVALQGVHWKVLTSSHARMTSPPEYQLAATPRPSANHHPSGRQVDAIPILIMPRGLHARQSHPRRYKHAACPDTCLCSPNISITSTTDTRAVHVRGAAPQPLTQWTTSSTICPTPRPRGPGRTTRWLSQDCKTSITICPPLHAPNVCAPM